MNIKKVGVAGLGIMGAGIANNLIKNGFDVVLWNRSENKFNNIEGDYTKVRSPKELAEKCDVLFEVTSDDDSSKSVWLEKDGLLRGTNSDCIGVVSSTISIDWVNQLKSESAKTNVRLIDAPLTGSRKGAESGNLTLLLGGDQNDIKKCEPVFEAIASQQFYFGEAGKGQEFKLILNLLQATHVAAMSQALIQADELGLNLEEAAKALMSVGSASPAGGLAIEEVLNTNPEVQFGLGMVTKDLNYANKALFNTDLGESVVNLFNQADQSFNTKYSEINWTKIFDYMKTLKDEESLNER